MNKLEKLIAELCPDGVEYQKLSEIPNIQRGVRVVKNQLKDTGKYPVYQNSLTPMGYHTDSNFPANTAFIIGAGAAGEVGYSFVDFWASDDCFCIVCPDEEYNEFKRKRSCQTNICNNNSRHNLLYICCSFVCNSVFY